MLRFKSNLQKQIQASAVVVREEGGLVDRIRLLKILYIADRESLAERGTPIIGGKVSALDNGPLHSKVYDLILGVDAREGEWASYFRNEGHRVVVAEDPGRLKLSPYEIEKLTEVSQRFRGMDSWGVVEATHQFPEWLSCHAKGTSKTIPLEAILEALGFTEDEVAAVLADAAAARRVALAFGK